MLALMLWIGVGKFSAQSSCPDQRRKSVCAHDLESWNWSDGSCYDNFNFQDISGELCFTTSSRGGVPRWNPSVPNLIHLIEVSHI